MPPVLAPLIASALVAGGVAATTATTLGTIIAYVAVTAITVGASFLLSQQKKPKGDPQQVTVKQAIPARTRSYGRVKVGGALVFMETGGIGALFQAIVHGEGEWDAIEEWWLNDQNAHLSGGAVTVLPWGSNITIESNLGSAGQAASAKLTSAFVGIWTSDHRLRGLAYSVMQLAWVQEKVFPKVYPNGPPALRVVARTAKVFDPRSSSTAFSENPALCIRDYLTHPRGFKISGTQIDDASFSAFANVCDEPVALSAGGTEARYRVALTYDMTQEPREVLRGLLQSCDAEIYPTADGKVGIRGGKWEAPTVTLNEDHILSYQYEQGNDKLAAFNRLKLTFTHREADYQPVEIDPWEDLATQAEVGVLQQDLTLQQVPSWTQARRLGKIFSARSNPRHRLTLRTNAAGILALGERCVHIKIAELLIDHDFFVEKFELAGDLTGDLTLASLDSSAYAWNPATEEGTPPTVPQTTDTTSTPPKPTGVALSLVRTEATAGMYVVKIRAAADALAGTPWQTIGRYRKVGDTAWIDMSPDGDWAAISDIVDDGGSYEAELAHSGYGGAASGTIGPWSDTETISTVADPTAPDLPSSLGVSTGSGAATVSWFNPTSANFYSVIVYRGSVNNFSLASVVGQVYGAPGQLAQLSDSASAGTYYWWVVSTNRSGAESAPVGPASGTVT